MFHAPGQPLTLDRLPTLEPQAAEALVRIECCTICGSDLHTVAGKRNERTPSILGHEIIGCWTVGVTRTGNGVGLSYSEVESLSPEELTARCDRAGETLEAAGAHYLLESVADLPNLLTEIDRRSVEGERPF